MKLIVNYGNGVDNVDLLVAWQCGITVMNMLGVLIEDTVDMTMVLVLAVPCCISEGVWLLRAGDWTGWSLTLLSGWRIWGKQLGIVGMGWIGCVLACCARGFGLEIHYHNRRPVHPDIEDEFDVTYWESLD